MKIIMKKLLENDNTPELQGPQDGPDSGIAALLIDAINGEWNTINDYNALYNMAKETGHSEMLSTITDINVEENKHIGQLQELLKLISPNAEALEIGRKEAEEKFDEEDGVDDYDDIDDDVSWFNPSIY